MPTQTLRRKEGRKEGKKERPLRRGYPSSTSPLLIREGSFSSILEIGKDQAIYRLPQAKRYDDSHDFTVDLSINHITPGQLLTLLNELPKLKLDLSANDFDWSDLKAVIKEGFNPRGYR